MSPVPLLTVCSLDPVLRDATVAGMLCDLPTAIAVNHDLTKDSELQRVVHDRNGVLEREQIVLDHGCLSCALRQDVISVLNRVTPRNPTAVVLALPATVQARSLIRALQPRTGPVPVPGLAVAAVLAAVDAAVLADDLFGEDLLAEREQHTSPEDRRSVGETLAQLVEYADVVVSGRPASATAADLLDHLSGPDRPPLDVFAIDPAPLLELRRTADDPRGDLRQVATTGAADTDRVWTVDLHSWRPFHSDRLHESLQALGGGPVRGRGVFWLPNRPHLIGGWDGAGRQLSIGPAGTWSGTQRRTRLVVTGLEHDRDMVQQAFERALLSDIELSRGLDWWSGREDGFDPWLGDRRLCA